LRKGHPDSWKWKDGEDGIFSVKIAYNALQSNVEEEENKKLKILWNTRVTPKAQILGWRVF